VRRLGAAGFIPIAGATEGAQMSGSLAQARMCTERRGGTLGAQDTARLTHVCAAEGRGGGRRGVFGSRGTGSGLWRALRSAGRQPMGSGLRGIANTRARSRGMARAGEARMRE